MAGGELLGIPPWHSPPALLGCAVVVLQVGGLGPSWVLGAICAGKLGLAVDAVPGPLSLAWLQHSQGGQWALSCRVTSGMICVPFLLPSAGFPPPFCMITFIELGSAQQV